jgi:predicted oxidoreductase (fatty acid repression mutant protein)
MKLTQEQAFERVRKELEKALEKHPKPFNSPHEGFAIIQEEVDELWDDVKSDNIIGQKVEAAQVAAVAIRYLMQV